MIDETAGPGREHAVAAKGADASRKLTAASPAKRANGTAAKLPRAAAAPRSALPRPAASGGARAFGVIGISLGAHMALMGVLGFMPTPADFFAHQNVEMEVIAPEPPPPPPPPPKVEEPPKPAEPEPPKPRAAPKAAPKPAEPEPPKQEAPPAPEAPVDLTGVTLTGGDGSWSSVVGSGGALNGPAPRVAANTGRDRADMPTGVQNGKGDKPVIVAEAMLSRKPVPPDGMDALLEQNFPPRARAQGVSGSALLAVRIMSDGRIGDVRLLRETAGYEFGTRCERTVRARRWQPALDRRGQPVATEIRYSCEFEVGY